MNNVNHMTSLDTSSVRVVIDLTGVTGRKDKAWRDEHRVWTFTAGEDQTHWLEHKQQIIDLLNDMVQ